MATRKLNRKEWAEFIELERRNKELKKKIAEQNREKKKLGPLIRIKKFVPGAIGIGIIALVAEFFWFGWRALLETVLSWIIGITIVTAYVATVSGSKKK